MKKKYEYVVFDLFGTITSTNYLASTVKWYYRQKEPDTQLIDSLFVDEIKRLSQIYTLFILSNSRYEYVTESLKAQGLIDCFYGLAISSDIKSRKPSEKAFRHIIQLGVEPKKSLLVDDRQSNRRVAIKLGFSVLDFDSKAELLQQLKLL